MPILLGGVFKATGNLCPAETWAHVPARLAYERLEIARFCDAHAIDDFRMNPHFPMNSLTLMRGAVAAEEIGVAEDYIEHVFAAMWRDGRKMDAEAIRCRSFEGTNIPWDRIAAMSHTDAIGRLDG